MTNFNTLYDLVRTAAGDFAGTEFSDADVTKALSFVLLDMPGYSEVIVGANHFVSPAITGNDRFILICKAALALLKGKPAGFSYKTPVISVDRNVKSLDNLMDWLESKIMEYEGDGMPSAADGSMEYYADSADRLEDYIKDNL